VPSHSPSDIVLPRSTLRGGSGARLVMPENSFVWGIEKIDSRPPKSSPGMHAPEGLGRNFEPQGTFQWASAGNHH
jgi:hypothetical protein